MPKVPGNTFRTFKELKTQFENKCKLIGVSYSTAIDALIKLWVSDKVEIEIKKEGENEK